MNAKKTFATGVVSLLSLVSTCFALEILPDRVQVPKDNPMTPAKINLGKQLFFDPRLSASGSVSCNSCHNVMLGGDDNRPTSVGVEGKTGNRSAPTVWNSAFHSVQFWDGRAPTLEEQAKGPLINLVEMGNSDHPTVVNRVKFIPGYVEQFKKVFGGADPVTIDNIAKAIAAYERTLITPNSPHDRFMKGDKKAMSAAAQRGMQKFQSVGCVGCHSGPNFSGPKLALGQGFFIKFPTFPGSQYDEKYRLTDDLGRYEVTKKDVDKHMYRVPTLRNIAITAPYFHNGAVPTLDEAVRVMAKTQLNKELSEEDVKDIVEFLKSLTGEFPKQTMPMLPAIAGASVLKH